MSIIRKFVPIHLRLHYPQQEPAAAQLGRITAEIYAAAVIRQLESLNCSAGQKQQLLDSLIQDTKRKSRDRSG